MPFGTTAGYAIESAEVEWVPKDTIPLDRILEKRMSFCKH